MNLLALITFLFVSGLALANPQADLSTISDTTATGSIEEIQRKNVYSHEQYSLAAVQLAKNAMMQYAHGSECQGSCPLGCCDSGDGLLFESGLFTMLNLASSTQAAENRQSALQACLAYNKLSSTQKDCAAEISPLAKFVPQVGWYDDKGRCSPTTPKECQIMEGFNVSPFKNIGPSCAGTQNTACAKNFFENIKLNSDGSITIKTSAGAKKVTLQDFSDPKNLVKLGLSVDTAKSLTQKYSQNTAQLKLTSATRLSYYNSQSVHSDSNLSENPQNQIPKQKNLGFESADQNDIRRPSTTDLHLILGDDPIGRPDDDLFKMIQKRYWTDLQKGLFN